jgi:histidinol-phosphate aminotransferase
VKHNVLEMSVLITLIRPDLLDLKPYSSARDEFEGEAQIFLDANENPFENGVNRYPDPLQRVLKKRIAELKGIEPSHLFLGNGSDECIDLLYRLLCVPGVDSVSAISPSYGMYAVSAKINNIFFKEIFLNDDFSLPIERILSESKGSKMLFICSPNNPTGNSFSTNDLLRIVREFEGIMVVDEAYIDFSIQPSLCNYVDTYANLVVCQTFSKAFGMAGIRLGMMFASTELISWINKIKPPYNIPVLSQQFVLNRLQNTDLISKEVALIKEERIKLESILNNIIQIRKVFPSDANFILIRVDNAENLYQFLVQRGIVVRNRSKQPLCENTLRLTVGTPDENRQLVEAIRMFYFCISA